MMDANQKVRFKIDFLSDTTLTMGAEMEIYLSNGHVVLGTLSKVVWDMQGEYPIALRVLVTLPKTNDDGPEEYVRVLNWDHVVEIRPRLPRP